MLFFCRNGEGLIKCTVDSIVCSLLGNIIIPKQRISVEARRYTRNPAVIVGYSPKRNANTLLDVEAGLGDLLEVFGLLCDLVCVNWFLDLDVELGNGNLEPGVGKRLELCLVVLEFS